MMVIISKSQHFRRKYCKEAYDQRNEQAVEPTTMVHSTVSENLFGDPVKPPSWSLLEFVNLKKHLSRF
jgi:hypothetical protein